MRLDLDRPFWPVLGSMFMFRLIIYLYELRREAARPPLAVTVAYFFPFQNVCFLFFPILDFRTFRDSYRSDFRWRDAQAGLVFVVRGLSHLLAYRVVKYYLLPSPHQLGDLPHLALFLAANYALYLHVSGYFHIVTGLFHLFGFGLPRTHHNYFLASSFTDIWRRINIQWKEFMAKLFFFPAFFAARRWGTRAAVVVAALWVFLATWLLHSLPGVLDRREVPAQPVRRDPVAGGRGSGRVEPAPGSGPVAAGRRPRPTNRSAARSSSPRASSACSCWSASSGRAGTRPRSSRSCEPALPARTDSPAAVGWSRASPR